MQIRFLTPFAIFLTLMLVTAAVCFYFHNHQIYLENQTQLLERDKTELVKHDVQAVHDTLELTQPQVGFQQEPFNKDPDPRNLDDTMMNTARWLQRYRSHLQGFVNIKSLQATEFYHGSALDPSSQLTSAIELCNQIVSPTGTGDFASAVTFVTRFDPAQPGSGIIADRAGLSERDEDRFATYRDALRQMSDRVETLVSGIRARLTEAQSLISDRQSQQTPGIVGLTPADVSTLSELIVHGTEQEPAAAEMCFDLIKTICYAEVPDEDADDPDAMRLEAIPGMVDSLPAQKARQLMHLLTVNDQVALRRILVDSAGNQKEPSLSNGQLAAELMGISPEWLHFNYGASNGNTAYRINPLYLGGVTLEDVMIAQDQVIRDLVHNNHLLARQLISTLAGYHYTTPQSHGTVARESASAVQRESDTRTTEVVDRLRRILESYEAGYGALDHLRTNLENEVGLAIFDQASRRANAILEVIEEQQELREDLMRIAARVRRGDQPLEAPVQLVGADGSVTHVNNDMRTYWIDRGQADHVHPGMRFVVYTELGSTEGVGGITGEIKGILEVIQARPTVSMCQLVTSLGEEVDLAVGDQVDNRLYHNRQFLTVACVGEFGPPNTSFTKELLEHHLRELGCTVQEMVDVNTQLVICATVPNEILPDTEENAQFLELYDQIRFDWILASDLTIYFNIR